MKKDIGKTKIINLKKLSALLNQYKDEGKKVGCMSGTFDLLTARHFRSLYECSKLCDVLIVLLNSNASVRSYKGPGKPIMDESERSYILAQSQYVSHIVIFDEITPLVALEKIKPHIFFNVSEWGSECIEKNTVEKYDGKIRIFDIVLEDGWTPSTSVLIEKVVSSENIHARRAVFFDRDGVINANGDGYIYRWEDFKLLPNVVSTLKRIEKAGYLLFIITNQSGIGRGLYSSHDTEKLHRKLIAYLKEQGVTITGIYFCPHHPDDNCTCRKPSPAMLLQAAEEHNLNLSKSWLIGDSGSDIDAGRQANVKTILIDSGEKLRQSGNYKPNFVIKNIKELVVIITK